MSDFTPSSRRTALARARARRSAWPPTAAASSAPRCRAPICSSISTPRAARRRRDASPIPTATTCSSPRGTTCPRSTARSPSSASSRRERLAQSPRRPTTTSTGTRTATSRASSSTPARSGTCCRSAIGVALDIKLRGGAEPRLRGPRRRRARRGLDLGGAARRRARTSSTTWSRSSTATASRPTSRTEELDPARAARRRSSRPSAARRATIDGHDFAALEQRVRDAAASSAGKPDRDHRAHRARQGPAQHRGARRPLVRQLHAPTRSRRCSPSCTARRRRALDLRNAGGAMSDRDATTYEDTLRDARRAPTSASS